jgi:hypothetical protein
VAVPRRLPDPLDDCLTKSAPIVQRQLEKLYDDELTREAIIGKAQAFRAMHLHGRALNELLPRAVDDIERYHVHDGEWIAGVVLGWNFGDGHLHHHQLLEAVQEQCGFEEGELRVVCVESQPIYAHRHAWRILDAATGLVEEGRSRSPTSSTASRGPRRETCGSAVSLRRCDVSGCWAAPSIRPTWVTWWWPSAPVWSSSSTRCGCWSPATRG